MRRLQNIPEQQGLLILLLIHLSSQLHLSLILIRTGQHQKHTHLSLEKRHHTAHICMQENHHLTPIFVLQYVTSFASIMDSMYKQEKPIERLFSK